MIYGIGVDICDVSRIREAIEKYGDKFIFRIFTDTEKVYCESYNDNKYVHYAARFAAKEAFSKAIGTGITHGFKFKEIGITNESNGKPNLELFGGLAEKWGSYSYFLSLSHTSTIAIAQIIIEKL